MFVAFFFPFIFYFFLVYVISVRMIVIEVPEQMQVRSVVVRKIPKMDFYFPLCS